MSHRRTSFAVALTGALLSAGTATGCSSATTETPTRSASEAALDGVEWPGKTEFDHGSFDFGHPITGVASTDQGRLASRSWDVYYVLDDGEVGAWGIGMDVFDSAEDAAAAVERDTDFWVCDGPRAALELDGKGFGAPTASTCRRPVKGDYYAVLGATDGTVTVNLTITADDARLAAEALDAVWEAVAPAAREAADRLS